MRINHNISAINTNRLLAQNNSATSKSLEKLSSGLAVNRAGDNAAGLAISEKMRAQVRGLDQASDNANDGISLIQTAEGGLNETHSILQRMRELAVQAANDTNTDSDRKEIQKEVDQLTKEITRISDDTEFNTRKLLDGSLAAEVEEGTNSDSTHFNVEVAPGSNITADGTYTIYHEGTKASTITGVTVTEADAASLRAGTYTFDGTNWLNAAKEAVDIESQGVAITGDASKGTTISISVADRAAVDASVTTSNAGLTFSGTPAADGDFTYQDASTGTVTGTATNKPGADTTYTFDGTKWVDGDGNELDATGLTIADEKKGDKILVKNTDGTATYTPRTAGWFDADGNAMTGVSVATGIPADGDTVSLKAAVTAGTNYTATYVNTDATFKITSIADEAGNKVSNASFNIELTDAGKAADLSVADSFTVHVNASNKALTFHIGANSGQNTKITIQDMDAEALGVDKVDLNTQTTADEAITTIDNAINTVSAQRAALGAMQNRLEHTINNLGTSSENLSAAESQIRDVDMAEEMSQYTKNNILVQAATSMLAQSNQQPQSVLSLLQG